MNTRPRSFRGWSSIKQSERKLSHFAFPLLEALIQSQHRYHCDLFLSSMATRKRNHTKD